jgi:uncharacterized protein YerC
MVHISKKYLDANKLNKLFSLFFEIVGKRRNKTEFESVINDIVSPTEKLMIAKRLAITYLLLKKIEIANICEAIKVSKSTVAKFVILLRLHNGGIKDLMTKMIKNEKIDDQLKDLFVTFFTKPSIYGRSWKLDRQREAEKKQKEIYGI